VAQPTPADALNSAASYAAHPGAAAVYRTNYTLPALLALGLMALAVLPWYGDRLAQSALTLSLRGTHWWLAPAALGWLAVLVGWRLPRTSAWHGRVITAGALFGVLWIVLQGFAVGMRGLDWAWFGLLGPVTEGQPGLGWGGFLALLVFVVLFSQGVAALGRFRGDGFVSGAVWTIGLLVALFVFFPVARVLVSAFTDPTGAVDLPRAWERFSAADIWGLGCVAGGTNCGVAWNSLLLAALAGVLSTLLGLAFCDCAVVGGAVWPHRHGDGVDGDLVRH
jgi:iron(III) transport system permease protein